MPATSKVQVIIDAKDNASRVLKGFRGQLGALGKSVSNVGADFRNLGKIALVAGAGLAALAVKAGMSAARIEELGFALHAIAKANDISTEAANESVKSLRGMNIAHAKALQITALFIQSQLDLTDATKLATAAKDLAVIAGLDSSEATETLTRAIVMQRPMLLKQFGIVKGLDKIYEDYRETAEGVSGELTELQKRQAFLNAILEAGGKVAGTYEAAMGSVSKRFRSLTGRIIPDFMAKIGKAFSPALTVGIDYITESIENMSNWIDDNSERIAKWGEKMGEAIGKGIKLFERLVEFLMSNKEILLGVFAAMGVGLVVLAAVFVTAHAAFIFVFSAIVVAVTLLAKVWTSNFLGIKTIVTTTKDALVTAFGFIKEKLEALGLALTTLKDGAVEFFRVKVDELTGFLETNREKLENVAKVLLVVFGPALATVAAQALTTAGIFTVNLIKSIITMGKEAIITALKFSIQFVKALIAAGVQALIFVAQMALVGVKLVFAATKAIFLGGAAVLAALARFAAAGWAVNSPWAALAVVLLGVYATLKLIAEISDRLLPKGSRFNFKSQFEAMKELGWIPKHTGGVVPGPVGTEVPVLAQAGEVITPAGLGVPATGGRGAGGIVFEVNIGMYVGTETEKRNIARELYGALMQAAQAQNKSVSELMNDQV